MVSFTDLYSTACEPPVVVFFDDQNQVVDTVDPKGLSMTSLVKELAVRGIKSHVRAAPGKKTVVSVHFLYKNDHFTKTGSGQT